MIRDTSVWNIPKELIDVSYVAMPLTVVKRNGKTVSFNPEKIHRAISRCFQAIGKTSHINLDELVLRVVNCLSADPSNVSVEKIQNFVEITLMSAGEFEAAKAYVLYRAEHARLRELQPVSAEVQTAFDESATYFPTPLQQFQLYDKYSRWNDSKSRRETWPETVERSVQFLSELVETNVNHTIASAMWVDGTFNRIRDFILNMKAMPSMRLLAMAGPAARRTNLAIYNCSFEPVDSIDSFVEALLLSMSGCGVGFSVERKHVSKLPRVSYQQVNVQKQKWTVEDSTEGWADSVRVGLTAWFEGRDVEFDFSLIRPAGTPLKIKGGRASGSGPLRSTLAFAKERILARQGSYLRPLDAHDLMCSIGDCAVSGGIRRTALISIFDIDDEEMARCKVGNFEVHNSQRYNANNSAVIPEDGITQSQFLKLWNAMVESERGEPGFISRQAMKNTLPSRRKWNTDFGGNPCNEIVLLPRQLCNLSICVARTDDTEESLKEKIEVATIIGTIQSLATHFPGMRAEWQENCKEERLLGVDITGQRDCRLLESPELMQTLRDYAIDTNKHWSERFSINQSAAVTCVKPSGNSSVLLDCASGIHPRWAKYYIRRVRVSATSPIASVLRDAGVPLIPELGQDIASPYTWVVEFPVKAPENTLVRNDISALDQFDYWLHNKLNWTEHNASVTIQYKPDEIISLMSKIWQNIEVLGGVSFLPYFNEDIALKLLPYEEINQAEYEKRVSEFPQIDFAKITRYEHLDTTTASSEIACVSGLCDV